MRGKSGFHALLPSSFSADVDKFIKTKCNCFQMCARICACVFRKRLVGLDLQLLFIANDPPHDWYERPMMSSISEGVGRRDSKA